MRDLKHVTTFSRMRHRLWIALGAIGLTLIFFLVLPLMQTISQPRGNDLELQSIDVTDVPPPPPPEPEPEKEEEPEEPPPELMEEAPPLDLSQLEMALNPSFGDGWSGGDFAVNLKAMTSQDDAMDAIFSMADLDQKPRAVYQPSPKLTKALRRQAPATVYIIFVVDERGRVISPKVQKTTNAGFNNAALAAIKQWKFEPGKRGGKSVRTNMRIPFTFPKG